MSQHAGPAVRSEFPGSSILRVYMIAGEASGDTLGGALMSALHELSERPISFRGVGGPAMREQGLPSLFDHSELSVMGLVEVLPHVPRLLRRMRQVARDIDENPPDVLITVDSPGFVFGVIRRLHGRNFPRIHYVAPTVWAWRPRRVHKFRRHFDHLMALLPFEPVYFDRVGLPCTFVGHPVTETGRSDDTVRVQFRRTWNIAEDVPLLCMLPGSRFGEVVRHLAPCGETVLRLLKVFPNLHVVVPTLPNLSARITAETAAWSVPVSVVVEKEERAAAMAASDVALAASGTVTLELAQARIPTIVAYRVSSATAWLLRRLVHVRFASIVNIIADREIIPEFIQGDMNPETMAGALVSLLADPLQKQAMRAGQEAAMRALGEGGTPPSRRAASVVLDVLADWRKTGGGTVTADSEPRREISHDG